MRTCLAGAAALLLPLFISCQPAPGNAAGIALAVPLPESRVRSLKELKDSLGIGDERIWFHVDKSERMFRVMADSIELKRYRCVLGENPVGDKFMQGDRRTPEGTFTFRSKRVHNAWHKFIWVDYPNAESWRRFNERKANGLVPQGKDIGGEIGIHGVPDGYDAWIDAGRDWTWGCIALKNADVDEIYPVIAARRTKLVIEP